MAGAVIVIGVTFPYSSISVGDGVLLLLVVDANVVADAVLEEPATGCEVVLDVGAGVLDDSSSLLVVLLLLVADADVVTVVVLEGTSRGCGVVLEVRKGVLDESAVVLGVTFPYSTITVAAGNPRSINSLLNLSSFKVEAGSFPKASAPVTLMLTSTRIPSASRLLRLDWDASIFSMATSAGDKLAAMARAFLNAICLSNVNASRLSARAKTILTVSPRCAGVGVEKV
jgi:hypothetical protein